MRSCAFVAQTLMFAAKQMGLDSFPMRGFEYDDLAKIINLSDDHIIVMVVVVGKAMELPDPRGGQFDLNEVVFENKFP